MKHFFPPQNQNFRYLQTNRSDSLGSLWSSFNLDFQSKLGTMRLANKLVTNTTSSDFPTLLLPVAFEFWSGLWWAVCGTRIFRNTTAELTSTFAEDNSDDAGIDYTISSDLIVFNDHLWSTSATLLRSKEDKIEGIPWVTIATLTSSYPHKMVYFKKYNRLYVINQVTNSSTSIYSVDTSSVVSTTGDYTLNPSRSVGFLTTMVANTSFIWIATFRDNSQTGVNANETKGSILQWDGFSNQVLNEFPIESGGVLAMCVVNDVPYAIDTEGRILKYTGYSFQEIARLPIDRTLLVNPTTYAVNHFIHFNGMVATKNNTILFLINNLNDDVGADVTENLQSGIWELDLETNNFTHKYSPTLKARSSSTITDYGQSRISAPGALKINYLQSNSANGRSTLIAGFNYFTDATTVKSGIFIDSPAKATTDNEGQKRGYFVTTWFESSEITDIWNRIWVTYRRFLNSTDKIVLKYRTTEEDPTLANVIWQSTTQFTTTTDVSAYDPSQSPFDGITGGEVEVLQGTGSGSCTHITSVSNNAGTYTVILDTAITGVTGTGKVRFQKWIKLVEITGQVLQYGESALNIADTRIQIKGVMKFTGDDEFHEMAIFSNTNLAITP